MIEALELPVADEEVVLYVSDHSLVLALCPRPVGAARPGDEPVMAGKVDEAFVEPDRVADAVLDDGTLLIVDEDLLRYAPKVLE